tara:strand:+ start:960 stop:1949 length:990 start_codon:yes stop_codon:yes gene_type:complete
MSIKPRGNGFEVYVSHQGTKFRRTVSTHAEATQLETVARQALHLGKPVPELNIGSVKTWGLQEAATKCYEMNWVGTKSEMNAIRNMKEVVSFFGKHMDVQDIGAEEIDEFIMNQKRLRKANGTINRKLACVSKILRFAHQRGRLSAMPAIKRLKETEGRLRYLEPDEEKAVIDTLEHWGYHEVAQQFIVSIDTGLRRSEMLNLELRDVRKEGIYVYDKKVGTKNDKPRVVPLTSRARAVLESRKESSNGKLFTQFYRTIWERVVGHLGLEDVVWHTLRHTTCSRLVQRGMPLVHVKEWMGHKAIQTTMRYAHLAPMHLQKGVELLEQTD